MRAAGARLDAYAHHPYPTSKHESPSSGGCGHCATITMATLERLLREVERAWPGKRVWLTEYGYQTNPPDRFLGVSPQVQARYVGEGSLRAYQAPRVDLLVHYLVRDEADVGRFQTGLFTAAGAAKPWPRPSRCHLQPPLADVWGQVRPGSGAHPYRLQLVRPNGSAAWLGGVRRTTARGFLTARVPRGSVVRLYSVRGRTFGVPVLVR